MTTWQKVRNVLIAMAVLFGVIGLFLIGQVVLEQIGIFSESVATIWSICFMVGVSASTIGFFWYMLRVLDPPEYRQARSQGVPATAQVLDMQATGARTRRTNSLVLSKNPSLPKYEYLLQVLVTPPGAAPYEATLVEMLETAKIPKKHAQIAVKVHPRRPSVVVLAPIE
jgi:hypothetical protein